MMVELLPLKKNLVLRQKIVQAIAVAYPFGPDEVASALDHLKSVDLLILAIDYALRHNVSLIEIAFSGKLSLEIKIDGRLD